MILCWVDFLVQEISPCLPVVVLSPPRLVTLSSLSLSTLSDPILSSQLLREEYWYLHLCLVQQQFHLQSYFYFIIRPLFVEN